MASSLMSITSHLSSWYFNSKLYIVIWSINFMCVTYHYILFELTSRVLVKSYLVIWLIRILIKTKDDPFVMNILHISLSISAAFLVNILSRIRWTILIILILSITQWAFINSLNSSIWMMDCSDRLVSFIIRISEWRLLSLILTAVILFSDLLSLTLCLSSTLAVLIVFKILLWIFLLKLLVFSH